ncbi:MAG: ADOP family duplicated permease [Gemmatimonadetes bacterium]|nr:ADOP family duplicated permease [Gemmatimonadota bacterium]MDA1103135.1 ADOP family duplicated permease [Gemmatimonadota bacterium]
MSGRRFPFVPRLYSAALRLLPPSVRREDVDEMVLTFAELWADAAMRGRRLVVAARTFGRLPAAIALEWLDVLGMSKTKTTGGWEMRAWGRNLRLAVRTLRKSAAFAGTVVFLIGLGVGAVTTIFTLVDHVLLRPLPYPAADRLVTVLNGSHSGVLFRAFEELDGVEEWVAGNSADANLTGEGDPIRIQQAVVTDGFFALFGGRPEIGRLLVTDDFEATDVVVLSHALWQTIFAAADDVVGRTIRIDGVPHAVVGVLAEDFEPPQSIVAATVDVWSPIDWHREEMTEPGYRMLEVAGRLAVGTSQAEVQAQLDALTVHMGELYPDEMLNREGEPDPMPLAGLQDATVQRVRTGLNLLFGAVGLLLLVACLNVAHLVLARGLGRVREMAVRRALGAGPGGLIQQLMAENLVLGAAGGLLGLGFAYGGLQAFMSLNPDVLPRSGVGLDLRLAIFAIGMSGATAILFGLFPALQTVGKDLTRGLKGTSRNATGGKGTSRLRGLLVVAEVAISLVLVAEAGLLLKSFAQVQTHQAGFETRGVWTIPLTPTGLETPEAYREAMDQIVVSLKSLPGIQSATYGLTQPFEFTGGGRCCWSQSRVEVEGEEHEGLRLMLQPVTDTYFETLRVPLLAGSTWSATTETERPVPAVLSERLAVELFGSAALAMDRVIGAPDRLQLHVVGVAADVRHYGLDQEYPTSAYVPISVVPFTIPKAHMAVRIRGEAPEGLARTLREAVWRASPEMPVPSVRSMEEWVHDSVSGRRFDSALFSAFGLIALVLAAAGLYGTLLYNVRQQGRELGIRIALGAARSRVEWDVVIAGLRMAGLGALFGLVGAGWVGSFMESRLFGVDSTDPTVLLGSALVLLLAAALASWLPARRAGRTDPLEALKAE